MVSSVGRIPVDICDKPIRTGTVSTRCNSDNSRSDMRTAREVFSVIDCIARRISSGVYCTFCPAFYTSFINVWRTSKELRRVARVVSASATLFCSRASSWFKRSETCAENVSRETTFLRGFPSGPQYAVLRLV